MSSFWSYWYFHIPNFVLAAIMYTVIGRLLLGLFVQENWDNFIWRGFKRITDPVVKLVRAMTPAALPHPVVLAFTALWLMAVRVAFLITLLQLGLGPAVATGG